MFCTILLVTFCDTMIFVDILNEFAFIEFMRKSIMQKARKEECSKLERDKDALFLTKQGPNLQFKVK